MGILCFFFNSVNFRLIFKILFFFLKAYENYEILGYHKFWLQKKLQICRDYELWNYELRGPPVYGFGFKYQPLFMTAIEPTHLLDVTGI